MNNSEKPKPNENLLPPTIITIVLAPHATAEHAKGLREKLQPGMTYIPELVNWDEKALSVLQEVADGELKPRGALGFLSADNHDMRTYTLQLLEELFDTKVKIELIDEQKSDDSFKTVEAQKQGIEYQPDFDQTLRSVEQQLEDFAKAQQDREQTMVERLLTVLEKSNQPQQLVLSLGAAHTGFVEKLKQQQSKFRNLQLNVEHKVDAQVATFTDQAIILMLSSEKLNQELLAKVLLEKLISSSLIKYQLQQVLENDFEVGLWIRDYIAKLSVAEIKTIYSQAVAEYQQQEQQGKIVSVGRSSMAGLPSAVVSVLQQRGLVLPQPNRADDYDEWV